MCPSCFIRLLFHLRQKYEKKWRRVVKRRDPVYQAVWANNTDFDEVLISPVMIQDHMPDKVLEALNKVLHHHNAHKGYKSFHTIHEIVRTTTSVESTGVRDVRL
ncbi:diacylglycerol lipase [Nesidiocoris tenuis]|uniref:Diacylglycerol lipase n=1 Tax=Nesidiocoris tenuis TaxID=355587 RepID=A0ABN7APA8_9HEMI|nr:diacylglycerol lipase [Nesidiocoris tenuis]